MSTKRGALKGPIFEEGARLFAKQGYERTSLQEVAEVLGVTKPALYYYFSSKEQLLFAIMSFVMDRVLSDVTQICESDAAPLDKLRELIRRYVSFFASHPAELTIMSTEVDSLGSELREVIVVRQRRYVVLVRSIVGKVLAGRSGGTLDKTPAVFALLGGMNWLFKWYDPAGTISPERLADDFMKIYTGGLHGRAEP